jgi:hypothetical protein
MPRVQKAPQDVKLAGFTEVEPSEVLGAIDLGSEAPPIDESLQAKLRLPPIPGQRLSWKQWQEWGGSLTEDQWSHLDMYVYRHWPVIHRLDVSYIDKLGRFEPLEYFIKTHGGGQYSMKVSDRNIRRREQTIMTVVLEIDPNEHEPIINLAELELTDKKNDKFITRLQNRGLITKEGKIVQQTSDPDLTSRLVTQIVDMAREQAKRSGGPDVESTATKAAIELVSRTSEKMIDQANRQAEATAKGSSLGDTVGLVKEIAGLVTPKDNGSSELIKLMVTMMQAQQQQTIELIKQSSSDTKAILEKMSSTASNDPLGNFDKLLSVVEKVVDFKSGLGGSGERSLGNRALDMVEGFLPMIAGPLVQGIINKGAASTPGAPPQPQALPPQANPPTIDVTPIRPSQPQQPNGVQEMPAPTELSINQVAQFIAQYGQFMIKAMNAGQTGDEFAQNLEGVIGYDAYLTTLPYFRDSAKAIEAAKLVPQFYQIVIQGHGEEKFVAFLEGVVEWNTIRNQESEGA